jgi:hypothetical protein
MQVRLALRLQVLMTRTTAPVLHVPVPHVPLSASDDACFGRGTSAGRATGDLASRQVQAAGLPAWQCQGGH